MRARSRLLIVAPAWIEGNWGGGKVLAAPLILALLAGLTPPDIDVRLVDENVERLDLNAKADLVAISCMTASAPRAYAIADAFRARHIPVVMGGIHPTVMPNEAALHADAVVIGEAEPVWEQVLADLSSGNLQQFYRSEFCSMKGLSHPRRELSAGGPYVIPNLIQTARGCPHACSFCTVSIIAGRKYRFRPVDEVVTEMRGMRQFGKRFGIVDDNIAAHPDRVKELFEAIIPLEIAWGGQADLNIARDPELLRLARRSGCKMLYVGLESVSNENLRATHKTPNLRDGVDMGEAIRTIQATGIAVIGSFVLGLDGDYPDVFEKTFEFVMRHKLAAVQASILTPFPGTPLRDQLLREDRIHLDKGWDQYSFSRCVFRPLHMSEEELLAGRLWLCQKFYRIPNILYRLFPPNRDILLRLGANLSYGRVHRGKGVL